MFPSSLGPSLLSGTKYANLTMDVTCPSLGISHFPKERGFPLVRVLGAKIRALNVLLPSGRLSGQSQDIFICVYADFTP